MSEPAPKSRRTKSLVIGAVTLILLGVFIASLVRKSSRDDTPSQQNFGNEVAPIDSPLGLVVRSSLGRTEAVRASLCGHPSSGLIELSCGVSLDLAAASATRLPVARVHDRVFLNFAQPTTAVFVELLRKQGNQFSRRNTMVRPGGDANSVSIGLSTRSGNYPTVAQPTYLDVLAVFSDSVPAPAPLASGVPKNATVSKASAEYLIQLAAQPKSAPG